MNVSFSKDGGAGASPVPVIEVETKTEQVPTPVDGVTVESVTGACNVPAVVNRPSIVSGDDLPAFREIMMPRINIVQNIGTLKDTFSPGEIVLGQQTVLFVPPEIDGKTGNQTKPGTPPVIMTVLGITQKRFHEIVVGGMGGQIVNSEAEVRSAGGTLDWKEWDLKKSAGMKRFGPMVDLLMVIRRPEHIKNDGNVFGFDIDDGQYALALWSLQKTSYTEGYKKILAFNRLAGVLKNGYPTHSFAVSTREQSYPGNKLAHVPVIIPNAKSTPAFADFVNAIVNPVA